MNIDTLITQCHNLNYSTQLVSLDNAKRLIEGKIKFYELDGERLLRALLVLNLVEHNLNLDKWMKVATQVIAFNNVEDAKKYVKDIYQPILKDINKPIQIYPHWIDWEKFEDFDFTFEDVKVYEYLDFISKNAVLRKTLDARFNDYLKDIITLDEKIEDSTLSFCDLCLLDYLEL